MSNATIWDHIFVVVVFFAYPLYARRTFPSFLDKVREQGEPARLAGYRETIATWLAFTAMLLVLWVRFDREWADLGLRWGSPFRLALGLALVAGLLWVSHRQIQKLATTDPAKASERLGDVLLFMPRSKRELRWFRAVSLNAGVTEELVYRGFLLWYLEPRVGLFWAAVVAVLAFTFAHAYQGLAQVPALALASASLVGLYLLTGSLLLPIVVHAFADIMQGNAFARHPGAKAPSSSSGERDEAGGMPLGEAAQPSK